MLIGYMRVSKTDGSQSTDLQRDALIGVGVSPSHRYEDLASDRRDDRPGLAACLKALRKGDTLIVSRFRSADDVGQGWVVDAVTLDVTPFSIARSLGPDSDTDARGLPNYLGAVAIRPDGRTFTVAGLKANIARGLVRESVNLSHLDSYIPTEAQRTYSAEPVITG